VNANELPGKEHPPLVILMPVFNDWDSLALLLPRLDAALAARQLRSQILIVDDGSLVRPAPEVFAGPFRALDGVEVLELRRNLGHQRAITVGLAFLETRSAPAVTVVMDSDGEDDPADVPRLLDRLKECGGEKIIFAERTRRSERLTFRFFYFLYQLLYRVLTGQRVRVGNFSAVPAERLASLVCVSEAWNHYAASIYKSRQPVELVATARATRLAGQPRMSFVNLVVHGLSAISVYSDVVGVRLLLAALLLILATFGLLVATVVVRLVTDWAIPGWATNAFGLLLVILIQAIVSAVVFSSLVLANRNQMTFLPQRDHVFFVKRVYRLGPP
jgi:hypothetical protein